MSPLVHFDGAWSTSEAELIEEAVRRAEQAGLPDLSRQVAERAAPWVATYRAVGTEEVYVASRLGTTGVLVAKSAPALAEKIRRLARTF